MRLLVCGGAGFIGSNFIRHMRETHPNVCIVNFDKLTYAGNLENLSDISQDVRYRFIQGDITDLEALNTAIQTHGITHVINFAAETHVDRSIHGGCKDFVLTNSLGVQMILDAVRTNKIEKFVNVSTDEVYGSLKLDEPTLFSEDTPITPNMPYAAAKAGGDLMCRAYHMTHGTPVVVTHCSNNYGPYQFPEKLIPFFIFKLLKGEKVPVYGDGKNVRDWIHVRDHARALDLLLEKGVPGEIYNIGVDNERNNLELTYLMLELMGFGPDRIEFITDRPGHDRRYAIDARKITALGWKPLYTRDQFRRGMQETIDWYRSHSSWVEHLREKKHAEMNSFQKTLNGTANPTAVAQPGMVNTSPITPAPVATLAALTGVPASMSAPLSSATTSPAPQNGILIFGAGYFGKRLAELMPNSVVSTVRIEDRAAVAAELERYRPRAVINAAGKTGTPNVDWCETNQVETYQANTVAPLLLAGVCQEKGIYLIQLASGCIFYGDSPDSRGWKEEDATNPQAFYSRTKYAADLILARLPKTAVVRLRLPIDFVPSPKNLITKLSGYKQVIDVQNSVTIVEDLANVLLGLIEKGGTGIFHATNPGALRYRDMLDLYRELVDPAHHCEWIGDAELATRGLAAKNRSTCILQSTRLAELGIHMRPIDIAIRATMERYAGLKKTADQTPAASPTPLAPPTLSVSAHVPEMKGMIAAGGMGSRLMPLTSVTNKHLLPVHNKPMVMYPLQTLLDAGIRKILIVTGPEYSHQFVKLLGSGAQYGCSISYRVQDQAGGIAQVVGMAEDFAGYDNLTVILGDNIFEDSFREEIQSFKGGAAAFYKAVPDPQRFGVMEVDAAGRVLSIEEKPKQPKSNFAQAGLYIYDNEVFNIVKTLKPSGRGELEIVDVNNHYLKRGKLTAKPVKGFWSDAGTFASMKRATEFFSSRDGS